MSDQTHLTIFSGHKKAWPVYITLGNLPSGRRNSPTSMAVLLLPLLPIPQNNQSPPKQINTRDKSTLTPYGTYSNSSLRRYKIRRMIAYQLTAPDGTLRRCFPILAAWIADLMENVALHEIKSNVCPLHGIKSNVCPRYEVPAVELGTNMKVYPVRDYTIYYHYDYENWIGETDHADITPESRGIRLGQNVFYGLNQVSPSDLHKPDMLHTVYLGLFKHMMDWIQDFLKKHGRLETFDEVWKALLPYPGCLVPKKAYREVTQWQGKKMRNLGRCVLGLLAVALRQPGSAQLIPFKRALRCVRALVDINIMAQY